MNYQVFKFFQSLLSLFCSCWWLKSFSICITFNIFLCIFCYHVLNLFWPSLLLTVTALMHLVRAFYNITSAKTLNTWLVFSYIHHPHGLVPQSVGVLLLLSGNEGEHASERYCSWWSSSGASPLHALHFLPTGTSKQDLSGMKTVWHRNVLE